VSDGGYLVCSAYTKLSQHQAHIRAQLAITRELRSMDALHLAAALMLPAMISYSPPGTAASTQPAKSKDSRSCQKSSTDRQACPGQTECGGLRDEDESVRATRRALHVICDLSNPRIWS
jgi:hypothetical protein